jgi:hypothetical protein
MSKAKDIAMKIPASCLVAAAFLSSSAVFAACEMPSLVASIPDGAMATEDELLAAQVEIQAYIQAMDRYIACQNEEMEGSRDIAMADYLFLMSTRIESARQEVDRIATAFNDEVAAFRSARRPGPIVR